MKSRMVLFASVGISFAGCTNTYRSFATVTAPTVETPSLVVNRAPASAPTRDLGFDAKPVIPTAAK